MKVDAGIPLIAVLDDGLGTAKFLSMKEFGAAGNEHRQKLRQQLFQCPALFGMLLAVVELRNPATGRYEHDLFKDLPDGGDSILQQVHADIFAEWLNLYLKEQENDVRVWLRWLDCPPEEGTNLLKRL